MQHLISSEFHKQAIFAGKAVITVQTKKSGKRFTYRIKEIKENGNGVGTFWVYLLTGPNNDSDYTYIGTIFDKSRFVLTRKSKVGSDAESVQVISWVVRNLSRLDSNVDIYHSGCCLRCGRTLTTPESVTSGIGPECIKMINNSGRRRK
jgi:hypothetical protein